MLKDKAKLIGIDAARAPVHAKPIYAPGQRFTGRVDLKWDTLPSACNTDHCIAYSETDRGIIQLLDAGQDSPWARIDKAHDLFG